MTSTTIQVADVAADRQLKFIVPSDEAIASFATAPTVWEGLYRWLVSEHCVVNRGGMPNRVHVGDVLMKKLERVEAKEIRKELRADGYRGDQNTEVQRSLSWSNGNAGPMATYDDRRLVGDGLFVLPDDEPVLPDDEPHPFAPV